MARHWSAFVAVSERQARALDHMADEHGFGDGRAILMHLASVSASKLSRMHRLDVQRLVDQAFEQYGRK